MNACHHIGTLAEELLKLGGHDPNKKISLFLANYLGCEEWDVPFMFAVAEIKSQVDEAYAQIEAAEISDRSRNLFKGAIKAVVTPMTPPALVSQPIKSLKDRKDKIDTIFVAADMLPHSSAGSLPKIAREDLIEKLNELIAEFQASDLDPLVRNHLVEQLELVLFALRNFETLGMRGVVRIFGAAAASFADAERKVGGSQTPDNPLKKGKWLLALIGGALIWGGDVVDGAVQLTEGGQQLLAFLDDNADDTASEGAGSEQEDNEEIAQTESDPEPSSQELRDTEI